jgi:hypothetical protein
MMQRDGYRLIVQLGCEAVKSLVMLAREKETKTYMEINK